MAAASENAGLRAPVIVLTASRSGSTLLRFLLDTHPDLACPSETGVSGACLVLTKMCEVLDGTGNGAQTGHGAVGAEAEAGILQFFDESYGRYLRERGKRRWCDKSLDNVGNADLIATIWPDAQFLCLSRHCMDVIASGIEVSSWGLSGFGFEQFSGQFPGNNVAAIGAYWAQTMTDMLEFQSEYPDRCYWIRYEDLVAEPERIAAGIFEFLGERQVPGIARECLRVPHEATGPGDEKIWFTRQIGKDSVGRGVRVPAWMVPPPVRVTINEALGTLGYRIVEQDWNTAAGPVDPRAVMLPPAGIRETGLAGAQWPCEQEDVEVPATAGDPAAAETAGSQPSELLEAVAELILERVGERPRDPAREAARRWPGVAGKTLGIAVTDRGQQWEMRWRIPSVGPACPVVRTTTALMADLVVAPDVAVAEGTAAAEEAVVQAGGPAAAGEEAPADEVTCLTGQAQTWKDVLTGSANMAVELRYGRLRWADDLTRDRLSCDDALAVSWLLGLSEVPSAPMFPSPAPQSFAAQLPAVQSPTGPPPATQPRAAPTVAEPMPGAQSSAWNRGLITLSAIPNR